MPEMQRDRLHPVAHSRSPSLPTLPRSKRPRPANGAQGETQMIREDVALYQDATLAQQAFRLLLQLLWGFALYGLGLFLTLAAGPGLFQAIGIVATLCLAVRCVFTGLELYRINRLMRELTDFPPSK